MSTEVLFGSTENLLTNGGDKMMILSPSMILLYAVFASLMLAVLLAFVLHFATALSKSAWFVVESMILLMTRSSR